MRVSDFEKAIDGLGIGIRIDEVVLSHNHVKTVFAHNGNRYFKWDGLGKAYSTGASFNETLPDEVLDLREEVRDWEWGRDKDYDLDFQDNEYIAVSVSLNLKYRHLNDALSMDDYYAWQCQCIDEMLRVTKGLVFYNIMMITGNKVAFFKLLGHYADRIREIMVWDKMSAEPAMHDGVLNREFEFVVVFDKHDCKGCQLPVMNASRGTLSNVLRIGKNKSTKHRAAFPLLLPQTIIHYFTNSGG